MPVRITVLATLSIVLSLCPGSGTGRLLAQTAQPPAAAAVLPASPEWARGLVWYQILIDRFANGDTLNDPTARDLFDDITDPWELSKWTDNWYRLSIRELLFNPSFYPNAFRRQYGGDLEGIRRRIDYLVELGVQGVVLSPIFQARSSHKYDPCSLHHVDPHFGPRLPADSIGLSTERPEQPATWFLTSADRLFLTVVRELRARGIRVVVDVQLAHVGANFWAFRDVLAFQEKSRFASWFVINEWDRPETPTNSEFSYKSMWGIDAFPEFRKDSLGLAPGPKEYVFAATRRWLDPDGNGDPSDGIDGWRVDLAEELPTRFWNEWVAMVKSVNPEAVIIGTPQAREPEAPLPFDAFMDAGFAKGMVRMVLNQSATPSQVDRDLTANDGSGSAGDADDRTIRILGTLETDRLASMCVNAGNPWDVGNSPQRNAGYAVRPPDAAERMLQRLLLLAQFTHSGSPMLVYGDEAGMWGGDDPDVRKPMVWPDLQYEDESSVAVNGDNGRHPVRFDSSLYRWYRMLIGLRTRHLALRSGVLRTVMLDDVKLLYGYVRQAGADRVFVVLNASGELQECFVPIADLPAGARIDEATHGMRYFSERGGVTLVIPPRTGIVLIPVL